MPSTQLIEITEEDFLKGTQTQPRQLPQPTQSTELVEITEEEFLKQTQEQPRQLNQPPQDFGEIREPLSPLEKIGGIAKKGLQTAKEFGTQALAGVEDVERGLEGFISPGTLPEERRIKAPTPDPAKEPLKALTREAATFLTPVLLAAGVAPGTIPSLAIGTGLAARKFFKNAKKLPVEGKTKIARAIEEVTGLDPDKTKRLIENPEIWNPKFFDPKSIQKDTLNKSIKAFDNAFKKVGKAKDARVIPILEKSKEKIAVKKDINNFIKDLIENDVLKKKGKLLVPGSLANSTEASAARRLIKDFEDLDKLSLIQTDKLRKKIGTFAFDGPGKGNKQIGEAANNIREVLKKKLPKEVQEINDEFTPIFDLKKELSEGKKLSKSSVESFLLNLQGKGKTFQMEAVENLNNLLPKSERFLDDALDEIAVKQFSKILPKNPISAIGLGAAGGLIGGPVGALSVLAPLSPRGLGTTLKEGSKFLKTPVGKGVKKSAQVLGRGAKGVLKRAPRSVLGAFGDE